MSFLCPVEIIRKNFKARVFFQFTLFVTIICLSFTAFFIHYQSAALKEKLLADGKLIVSLLANSARVGVFSEGVEYLQNPVDGTFLQTEVLSVDVWTSDGKPLLRKKRPGLILPTIPLAEEQKRVLERTRELGGPVSSISETEHLLEIWAPVISVSAYNTIESLYFQEEGKSKKGEGMRVIGLVEITLAKGYLNEKLRQLLIRSVMIAAVFLVLGLLVAYLVAKNITQPLNKLTSEVKAFGEAGEIQRVNVETKDEIGRLGWLSISWRIR